MTDRVQDDGHIPLIYSFHNTGHHARSWRHPSVEVDRLLDPGHYARLAEIAERGLFDALFLADFVAFRGGDKALGPTPFEPISLLSYLSARTRDIGLIGTVSTSVSEPYSTARLIATLDHLSNGRSGVNLVTSRGDAIARNYSRDALEDHSARYARAAEFTDVVKRLLLSWEPDAIVGDQVTGSLVDPDRIESIDHSGERYRVAGPLDVPRTPQSLPVFLQAGSSDDGVAFAAREADVIYARSLDLTQSVEFRSRVRRQAAEAGRDPDRVKVFVGLVVYAGADDLDAQSFFDSVVATTSFDRALENLRINHSVDLRDVDLDGPVPLERFPDPDDYDGSVTGLLEVRFLAEHRARTVRDYLGVLSSGTAVGMQNVVGSGAAVADTIERWHRAGAADGFVILAPQADLGLPAFVDHVVPELQRRGLYKTAYVPGATLRERLGVASIEQREAVAR